MSFDLLLGVLALLAAGSGIAAVARRWERAALTAGTATAVAACAAGLGWSVDALLRGVQGSARVPWPLPVGEIHVGVDPLTSFFLLCVFTVSGLSALYGWGYLKSHLGHGRVAVAAALYNLLVASMVLLVLARDGVLFLIAWEIMSIASFFLVTFEDERESVRRAGMTYLIASHAGAAFLLTLFVILAGGEGGSGGFDFDRFASAGAPLGMAGVCFLLAVVGFGTKAGFWPFHVWLPDAHPAAPSHVSALMSGVMIKMGIYGLLRSLTFLGAPDGWWGTLLVLLGVVTGLAGVLQSLAQRQLKRLLAYSSVENIGIIAIGIGLGVLGQSRGEPGLAALGYTAALLHTLNHGLFKGLLFQAAGAVLYRTGEGAMDAFGGLSRRMPSTALAFAIGSAALCGLPPLNGFVSEWLAYIAAFRGASVLPGPWALSAMVAVPALALIGGLAVAGFARTYGVVFLGNPRTEATSRAREVGVSMLLPMLLGAAACVGIGLWPQGALRLLTPAVGSVIGAPPPPDVLDALTAVARVVAVLIVLIAAVAALRFLLLARREVRAGATWACGYPEPAPRMQYTSSSFSQLLLDPFAGMLAIRTRRRGPEGYFPREASFEEQTGDPVGERLLIPAARHLIGFLSRLRVIQQGRVQLYLAYIFATLVLLLLWQLGSGAVR